MPRPYRFRFAHPPDPRSSTHHEASAHVQTHPDPFGGHDAQCVCLNLGILAHVDAGKTTLTERLLHDAGVIDELGSVDDGNTQTDTLALERRRGITIKSAVVSFAVGDVAVNLIDTPGHPDFIAEVERVLGVLDGAVLVVSAVEGVQAQTRVLMRALQRLRDPDAALRQQDRPRAARDADACSRDRRPADAGVVPMGAAAADPGAPARRRGDRLRRALLDVLAEHDDALLAAYVDGDARCARAAAAPALAAQTARRRVHPVFAGSAITGAGVAELIAGITELLPARRRRRRRPGLRHACSRSSAARRARRSPTSGMFAGHAADARPARLGAAEARSPRSSVFDGRRGRAAARRSRPGQIGRLWGLAGVRIGDAVGARAPARTAATSRRRRSRRSSSRGEPADRGALHVALDPARRAGPADRPAPGRRAPGAVALALRRGAEGGHPGHAGRRLRRRGRRSARRRRSASSGCVGTGAAVELIGEDAEPVPGHGRPARRAGAGRAPASTFRLEVELGSMPPAFFTAVEETVPRDAAARASTAGRCPTAR